MDKTKILKRFFSDFFVAFLLLLPICGEAYHGDVSLAEEVEDGGGNSYPYNQTFIISAYYSPLPCQNRYATGSYNGDIRLNGGGVRGADGTPVYPGMIAAPKSYAFGTKMYIPNIGIVAVHDRGGAIVDAGQRGNSYDRLDIWMGYGDKGLQRALNWGKRTVDVTLYGITDSVVEEVNLFGYSEEEKISKECVSNSTEVETGSNVQEDTSSDNESLSLGDKGDEVEELQEELTRLNFYRGEINGVYDTLTAHAVFKFQQSQGIVATKDDQGAGVFGPKTNSYMAGLQSKRSVVLASLKQNTEKVGKDYVAKTDLPEELVAAMPKDATEELKVVITSQMDYGTTGSEVEKLQKFLKSQGFYTLSFFTDYFGETTKEALIKFQLANGLISSAEDSGAGRVGPNTLELINSLS